MAIKINKTLKSIQGETIRKGGVLLYSISFPAEERSVIYHLKLQPSTKAALERKFPKTPAEFGLTYVKRISDKEYRSLNGKTVPALDLLEKWLISYLEESLGQGTCEHLELDLSQATNVRTMTPDQLIERARARKPFRKPVTEAESAPEVYSGNPASAAKAAAKKAAQSAAGKTTGRSKKAGATSKRSTAAKAEAKPAARRKKATPKATGTQKTVAAKKTTAKKATPVKKTGAVKKTTAKKGAAKGKANSTRSKK